MIRKIFVLCFLVTFISRGQTNQSNSDTIFIDPLSVQSLYLEQIIQDSIIIGTATGFTVEKNGKTYLITNWHVVTGIDPNTNKILHPQGIVPEKLGIWHNLKNLGNWARRIERLYANNNRRWLEHPRGKLVDVIALPLEEIDDSIQIYSFDLELANVDMIPEVAMPISIIGFPNGLSGPGKMAIWKTGHIATEPNVEFNNEPFFMVDATTRSGMSGSPVLLRLWGGFKTKNRGIIMSSSGIRTRFLGIYSAQWTISELGKVWFPKVIDEIIK